MTLADAVALALAQPGNPKLVTEKATTLGEARQYFPYILPPGAIGPAGPQTDDVPVFFVEVTGINHPMGYQNYRLLIDQKAGVVLAEHWWR